MVPRGPGSQPGARHSPSLPLLVLGAQYSDSFSCGPLPLQCYLVQGLDEGLDEPLPVIPINHASPDLWDTEKATESHRA